jgi:hypothetical protein
MTHTRTNTTELSKDEWNEMIALKNAINYNPQTVIPEKMEEFSSYLVQSLKQRGG